MQTYCSGEPVQTDIQDASELNKHWTFTANQYSYVLGWNKTTRRRWKNVFQKMEIFFEDVIFFFRRWKTFFLKMENIF